MPGVKHCTPHILHLNVEMFWNYLWCCLEANNIKWILKGKGGDQKKNSNKKQTHKSSSPSPPKLTKNRITTNRTGHIIKDGQCAGNADGWWRHSGLLLWRVRGECYNLIRYVSSARTAHPTSIGKRPWHAFCAAAFQTIAAGTSQRSGETEHESSSSLSQCRPKQLASLRDLKKQDRHHNHHFHNADHSS